MLKINKYKYVYGYCKVAPIDVSYIGSEVYRVALRLEATNTIIYVRPDCILRDENGKQVTAIMAYITEAGL